MRFFPAIMMLMAGTFATGASHAGDKKVSSTDGPFLYHEYCSVCHGDNGDGNSRAKNSFARPPLNFRSKEASGFTRDYMVSIVRDGKKGTAMVGWKRQLTDESIGSVVDHVRERFMGKSKGG